MNSEENENLEDEQPQNAVSVYGAEGAMDDFPVLKAFQQYIDAEQNKARRRMVTLCILFGVMTCIMVGVFMLMLHDISMRNQQLNDRLVEYAMKDRDRDREQQKPLVIEASPQLAAQNSANEAALKTMTETLVALQKQITDQQKLSAEQQRAAIEAARQQAAMQQAQARGPSQEEIDLDRKIREASEKIRRARAILEAEKKKFQEEKERLHREEVERQRRRLYPEFYGEKTEAQQQPVKPQVTDADIQDILREADTPSQDSAMSLPPAAEEEPVLQQKSDEGVIEYFKDDEYSIPVDVNGSSRNWQVPLN